LAWNICVRGLFADTDNTRLRPDLNQFALVIKPRLQPRIRDAARLLRALVATASRTQNPAFWQE
jgi:hypothetical protein